MSEGPKLGLFHLEVIPPFIKKSDSFVQFLFRVIREASDRDGGRDIPVEDLYRSVLSYLRVRDDVFIVRFSNINEKGLPFGNLSLIETLKEIFKTNAHAAKYTVLTPRDGSRYEHFYNPEVLDQSGQDFLWAPEHRNIESFVVLKSKRASEN